MSLSMTSLSSNNPQALNFDTNFFWINFCPNPGYTGYFIETALQTIKSVGFCLPTPDYVNQIHHPGVAYSLKFTYPGPKETNKNGTPRFELLGVGLLFTGQPTLNITQNSQLINDYKKLVRLDSRFLNKINQDFLVHCLSQGADSKGCFFLPPAGHPQIKFIHGVNPKKTQNHATMFESIRSLVEQIDLLSDDEIEKKLLLAHGALFKDLSIAGTGKYRNKLVIVHDDNQVLSQKALEEVLRSKIRNNQRYNNAKTLLGEVLKEKKSQLTDKEREMLSPVGYIPCNTSEIKQKMKNFFIKLRKDLLLAKTQGAITPINPIELATYAHQEIGSIHPFIDGNGRIARAFMNAILMNFELPPAIFEDDTIYTQKVTQESNNPGTFADYLAQTIDRLIKMENPFKWLN